jgi:glyoxylase-like metal-dependent hydrolase (beta-lactamase superfamily II)
MMHTLTNPLARTLALLALLTPAACTGGAGNDGTTDEGGDVQHFAACEAEVVLEEPDPTLPWTPNAIELVSEQVAPGVFAVYDANADEYGPAGIPLATSGGFVIGSEGVLLIETMINRQLLCQLVALVREQTDLPITYAINTSYHGDHSFGNAFLPDEIEIVQHERTAAHIASSFAEDVAFMSANFGADQGIDEVVAVAADIEVGDVGWSVDLGGVEVEARYFGFGQTEGDLFVYVPDAGVLWTGNPLIAEQPAIPWLLDGHVHEVGETLASVQASLPSGAIVVPGHDRPVGVDEFTFSIEYLAALESGVGEAVAAGLSVEETVATVTLDEFSGYALWDWVHVVLNVPVTYAEAQP